jgi:murein DD-endopeptidase MepM/ murein hydrolase activator NlpD
MAQHRVSPPSTALRGRVVVAAVAVGAFAAAAAGQTLKAGQSSATDDIAPVADSKNTTAAMGVGGSGSSAAAPEVLMVANRAAAQAPVEAQQIASTNQIMNNRAAAAAAAKAEAERPKYVSPAEGRFTSGYGGRWGTTHYGIDIANRIGTPILSVADGTVIEAGTASGFGLWVRVQHEDGTISVYGHVDTYSVREGQKVKAGEQIARMGNRGYSTGPHLHFEIWDGENGRKLNPRTWLLNHGVSL